VIGWRRERRDLIREHQAELQRERAAFQEHLAAERAAFAEERRELLEQLGRAFDRLALVSGRPTPARRESSFEPVSYDPLLVEGDPFADVLEGVT
jgi:hypothetical protein